MGSLSVGSENQQPIGLAIAKLFGFGIQFSFRGMVCKLTNTKLCFLFCKNSKIQIIRTICRNIFFKRSNKPENLARNSANKPGN